MATDYAERNRDGNAARNRERSAKVADIGDMPSVVNPARKEDCRENLLRFLQEYFPNSTGLSPFSEDHIRVIERIQRCIIEGGRFCNAVYRGFAKTTIATNAAIWSVLYGHRRYVAIFSANEPQAQDILSSVKLELSENDLLYEDFPEVCHAVRALEGKVQRCHSQTYQGTLTHIAWRADRVAMPYIQGSKASGALIASRGMTGSGTRGLVWKTPKGTNQRPDLTIVDDPQTDETAATVQQVRKRLDILKRSILKLSGHNKQMACIVNATVIARDDMIEQLLNPKKNPAWQGERIRMVRQWSSAHESFWLDEYANVRNTFDRDNPEDQRRARAEANDLYEAKRDIADAGCVVSWEHCFDKESEISAIQHAYNMLIDDGPEVFSTECQNEPVVSAEEEGRLSASEIAARLNGFKQKEFPRDCEYITAMIDVQQSSLYYAVCGWHTDFTGYIIDYGTFPEQNRKYFRLKEMQKTLDGLYPGEPLESQIFQGLENLVDKLAVHWKRADNADILPARILIDANWGYSTKTVKRFCQTSKHARLLMAAHGRSVRAGDLPMGMWPHKAGERRGVNWLIRPDAEATGLRHVLFDTNYWKSFIQARLTVKHPAAQSLSLWGHDHRAHEMLADHMTAETPVSTEGRGRKVEQWELRPDRPDNHFLDCVVGAAVAASMEGAKMDSQQTSNPKQFVRKRPKVRDLD